MDLLLLMLDSRLLLDGQMHPGLDASRVSGARREFEHEPGSALRTRPPRPDAPGDPKDLELAVKEDDIDRETHEARVNGPSRREQKAVSGPELGSAHEAPEPRPDGVCHWAGHTHHARARGNRDRLGHSATIANEWRIGTPLRARAELNLQAVPGDPQRA